MGNAQPPTGMLLGFAVRGTRTVVASVVRVCKALVADGAARVHATRAAVEDGVADLPYLAAHARLARTRVVLGGSVPIEHAAAVAQHGRGLELVLLQVADGVLAHALDGVFGRHQLRERCAALRPDPDSGLRR